MMLGEDVKLPADISHGVSMAEAKGDVSSGNASNLPNRPPLEQWHALKKEINLKPNSIVLWEKLFDMLDAHFNTIFEQQQSVKESPGISDSFKKFAFDAYTELLTRFPLLTHIWKKFLIFEYKLHGMDSSVKVLSKAVDCFPGSISLWVDYLSALIEQHKSRQHGDASNEEGLSFIRSQFELAVTLNGSHFLSHPLWDKYIEFEESTPAGVDPLLYFRVAKLPLYEYSKYYQKFSETNKRLTIEQIFKDDVDSLHDYQQRFNKETSASFDTVETQQVIDDYSYKIFTQNQNKVNSKWQYESLLTFTEFGLDSVNSKGIASETKHWIAYLDYAVGEATNSTLIEEAISIFERALIPNCMDSSLWLKYISFISSQQGYDQKLDQIYSRAINKFIPLDDNFIRFNYVLYLHKKSRRDEARDYLYELIQLFVKENRKQDYLDAIDIALDLDAVGKTPLNLEKVITSYTQAQSQSEHKTGANELTPTQNILMSFLRDDSIRIVVNKHLGNLKREGKRAEIRSFFNTYSTQEFILLDAKFWHFYVNFEGITMHSMTNLKAIMQFVKTQSKFSKVFVDSLVEIENDIVSANVVPHSSTSDDRLILKDIEVSNSLSMNKSWKSRTADMNFQINDLESSKAKVNKVDEYKNLLRKRVGHAGIVVESTPEITNSTYEHGWTNLHQVPPLPTFKNVERANSAITYPPKD